ncbi:hypothetical protein FM076_02400 [Streptomyces albus subsp. chlorinus]|uniref:hypothetical protein n=1 Tax=Streptomyces albus TaxID=1888 RepID=UPI001570EE99|nr:hypothetical protein [Streptomyces albus]NSC20120.1 hypothetical protein [Streptomyces albus subsp. chlorinus]
MRMLKTAATSAAAFALVSAVVPAAQAATDGAPSPADTSAVSVRQSGYVFFYSQYPSREATWKACYEARKSYEQSGYQTRCTEMAGNQGVELIYWR